MLKPVPGTVPAASATPTAPTAPAALTTPSAPTAPVVQLSSSDHEVEIQPKIWKPVCTELPAHLCAPPRKNLKFFCELYKWAARTLDALKANGEIKKQDEGFKKLGLHQGTFSDWKVAHDFLQKDCEAARFLKENWEEAQLNHAKAAFKAWKESKNYFETDAGRREKQKILDKEEEGTTAKVRFCRPLPAGTAPPFLSAGNGSFLASGGIGR
ncbi:hypothetical protein HDU96_003803, partial [Phlyctochytrium bullatum]